MYYTTMFMCCLSTYSILVMLRTFPTDPEEQMSPSNIFHVSALGLVIDITNNFWFTTSNAIVMVIEDHRIAGIHITMMTSLTNMAQFAHKFYMFRLVDQFGLFIPQVGIFIICFSTCLYMRKSFCDLDKQDKREFWASDSVIYGKEVSKDKSD